MKKAYNKDVWRTMLAGKKRFFSIMLITMLGVTMLTGIKAACVDLRNTSDSFFDRQKLFDICIVSTLGLTEEDVEALEQLDEIETAEGAYSGTVHTRVGERKQSAEIKTLSRKGINMPYLLEGVLPKEADEIAVTEKYIQDMGAELGDTLVIEAETNESGGDLASESQASEKEEFSISLETENEQSVFSGTAYTITAIVIDPTDINNADGAVAFRSSATTDYTFFVAPEAVNSDIYTAVYLTVSGGSELLCYSSEYEAKTGQAVQIIEDQIKEQREQERYDAVTSKAYGELSDAEQEIRDQFAKADREFAEAGEELEDGWTKLEDGQQELANQTGKAMDAFSEARQQIADGYTALDDGAAQLEASERELEEGEWQLSQAKEELSGKQSETKLQLQETFAQMETGSVQAKDAQAELEQQLSGITSLFGDSWPAVEWEAFTGAAEAAYLPVITAQSKVSELEMQLASMQSDTSEYQEIVSGIHEAKMQTEQAESAVAEAIAHAQDTFLEKFLPAADAVKQRFMQQLAGLNQESPEYAMQQETLRGQINQLEVMAEEVPKLAVGIGQLRAAQKVFAEQQKVLEEAQAEADLQFQSAWDTIADNEAQLIYGKQRVQEGRQELEINRNKLDESVKELEQQEKEAMQEIADGKQEILDNRSKLEEGEKELEENHVAYQEKQAVAEEKLQDAREEITGIDMAEWYVQDRSSLSGYANIKSDAASIEAIGTVFPIVFFVVAILISLTTITRMVEEDRGLIGTYKALGFTDREIRRKYFLYAFAASAAGGVLGDLCGYIVLPKIIFRIFETMYLLPEYLLQFDFFYGIGSILLFGLGIVGASAAACRVELRQMPAVLMRPRAPRSGSRVLLEYVPVLWNRFSFLNKVTARNLFRYKKRLFMTVAGIMGCTALVLFGFAIKDSVTDLMPRQYEEIYQYDLMAVSNSEDYNKLISYVSEDENVEDFCSVYVESVKIKNKQGDEEKVQLIVVPDGASLDGYIYLENLDGESAELSGSSIYITQNAANILEFDKGETVLVQDLKLIQREAEVTELVKNYLGNNIYMTQEVYEDLFGHYEPNGVLVHLSDMCQNPIAVADELGQKDEILSVVSTEDLKQNFSTAFTLINMVVYIILIMAAGLALIVLFTLSTTNISERVRELATIKVLGFYDREVHLYVNKETLILTLIGIVLGLPLGYAFGSCLTYVLNMPSIYLAVSLHPVSYVIASVIAFAFALFVDLITNGTLDKIDPVEALKSVE